MRKLQLFRIEHPCDRRGLWRAEKNGSYIVDEHSQYDAIRKRHQSDKYPNFSEDVVLNAQLSHKELTEHYKFAFNTLSQLKKALTSEEIKECITKLGFKIYLIKTDMYYKSPYQAVFNVKHIISKEDVSSLFL